jgi:hypothetical protein
MKPLMKNPSHVFYIWELYTSTAGDIEQNQKVRYLKYSTEFNELMKI